jgi:hypothetical protein
VIIDCDPGYDDAIAIFIAAEYARLKHAFTASCRAWTTRVVHFDDRKRPRKRTLCVPPRQNTALTASLTTQTRNTTQLKHSSAIPAAAQAIINFRNT